MFHRIDYQQLTKIFHAEHGDYLINKSSVADISATKMYNFDFTFLQSKNV